MRIRVPGRSRLPTLVATLVAVPLVFAAALLPRPAPAGPGAGGPGAVSPFLCHVEASDLALVIATSPPRQAAAPASPGP